VTIIGIPGDDAWSEGQDAGVAPPNEGNLMGRIKPMKALTGCVAAMSTQTGQIGYLGPLINFETRRLVASAYLGARHCYGTYRGLNPDDLEFTVTWIGFWFNIPTVALDPTEVVKHFFDSGVDVVISGIDTTEVVVVVGQRSEAGEEVFAVRYDYKDACAEAPDI
jgi:simple sugar transport system substrate-binding protein